MREAGHHRVPRLGGKCPLLQSSRTERFDVRVFPGAGRLAGAGEADTFNNGCPGRGARFYFLLVLFPALLFLVALLAYVPVRPALTARPQAPSAGVFPSSPCAAKNRMVRVVNVPSVADGAPVRRTRQSFTVQSPSAVWSRCRPAAAALAVCATVAGAAGAATREPVGTHHVARARAR
jgi:hypothetical protein